MLWMMVVCLLPLVVLLFAGGKLSGGYLWPVLIGGFVLAHVWMMFKSHRSHEDESKDKTKADVTGDQEDKDNKSR